LDPLPKEFWIWPKDAYPDPQDRNTSSMDGVPTSLEIFNTGTWKEKKTKFLINLFQL
jgi:hypothetical protein